MSELLNDDIGAEYANWKAPESGSSAAETPEPKANPDRESFLAEKRQLILAKNPDASEESIGLAMENWGSLYDQSFSGSVEKAHITGQQGFLERDEANTKAAYDRLFESTQALRENPDSEDLKNRVAKDRETYNFWNQQAIGRRKLINEGSRDLQNVEEARANIANAVPNNEDVRVIDTSTMTAPESAEIGDDESTPKLVAEPSNLTETAPVTVVTPANKGSSMTPEQLAAARQQLEHSFVSGGNVPVRSIESTPPTAKPVSPESPEPVRTETVTPQLTPEEQPTTSIEETKSPFTESSERKPEGKIGWELADFVKLMGREHQARTNMNEQAARQFIEASNTLSSYVETGEKDVELLLSGINKVTQTLQEQSLDANTGSSLRADPGTYRTLEHELKDYLATMRAAIINAKGKPENVDRVQELELAGHHFEGTIETVGQNLVSKARRIEELTGRRF